MTELRALALRVEDALTFLDLELQTPTIGSPARALQVAAPLMGAAEGVLAVATAWIADAERDREAAETMELGPTHAMLYASAYERDSKAHVILAAMAKALGVPDGR